jgi:hypothetical protein
MNKVFNWQRERRATASTQRPRSSMQLKNLPSLPVTRNSKQLPDSFNDFIQGKGYVISLDRHKWRGEHTLGLLKNAGFENVEIFKAIDGYFDDTAAHETALNIKLHPDVYPGARGATLSMIYLYKKVIDENLPYLFIFEDDALPHSEFKTIAADWYRQTDKDLDFLFMGSQFEPTKFPRQPVIQTPAFCLHAYCITNAGAKHSMELLLKSSTTLRPYRRAFPGVDVLDIEVSFWMNERLISWQNWNIEGIVNYSHEIVDGLDPQNKSRHIDCIRAGRHGGLIWQNLRCGTCMHGENVLYAFTSD